MIDLNPILVKTVLFRKEFQDGLFFALDTVIKSCLSDKGEPNEKTIELACILKGVRYKEKQAPKEEGLEKFYEEYIRFKKDEKEKYNKLVRELHKIF